MSRVEELFQREDSQFLDALRELDSFDQLAAFTDRWKNDSRAWARQQIIAYLQLPMNCPGHQTVVKRLFKHAEENRDDELMALFLVAVDRLVRRERKTAWRWNWETNDSWSEEILVTPRNSILPHSSRQARNPRTGEVIELAVMQPSNPRLFSYHTRYYLRRRAWRYFRAMGFQRPDEYAPAIARALVRYQDEDLQQGEDILENWGLVQACFHHHAALTFQASRIDVAVGSSLAELNAMPRFPEAWQNEAALDVLFDIVRRAKSRLVRIWGIELLRTHHAKRLATVAIDVLVDLLNHADEEVQQFAGELLEGHAGLDTLPVEMWLRLLAVRNITVLETICQVMREHVTADRLTLDECIQLACVEVTSVARLGFDFLQSRNIETAEDRSSLRRLAAAKCEAIGGEMASWALGIVGQDDDTLYDVESVCYFFDSLLASIRQGAWQWLLTPSRGYSDSVLWTRILETPFDDLRLRVVEELERRAKLPGVGERDLTPVWSSVLLGVHRGGRQKAKAVRQIGAALERSPDRVDELLPVLVVAIRSIRQPEFRAGLAAIIATIQRRPQLADVVRTNLPELDLSIEESVG